MIRRGVQGEGHLSGECRVARETYQQGKYINLSRVKMIII